MNQQTAVVERSKPDLLPSPRAESRSSDWWLVVRKFLSQGTAIASIAPSSRFMARSIIRGIDWDKAKVVVELGAGTGPITKELLKRVKPGTRAIIVEREPEFVERLRKHFPKEKYPQAEIVQGDAAFYEKMLDDLGIDKACHVLSGLPLPSFPKDLRDNVLAAVMNRLAESGSFRQLTNMPWVYRGLYRSYFHDVKFQLVPLNLPPGGVYVCKKFRNKV